MFPRVPHTARDVSTPTEQLRPDAARSLGSGAVWAGVWTEAGPLGRRDWLGCPSRSRAGDTVTGVQGDHPGIFYPAGGFEPTVSGALRPRSPGRHALTRAAKRGEARGPRGRRVAAPA